MIFIKTKWKIRIDWKVELSLFRLYFAMCNLIMQTKVLVRRDMIVDSVWRGSGIEWENKAKYSKINTGEIEILSVINLSINFNISFFYIFIAVQYIYRLKTSIAW